MSAAAGGAGAAAATCAEAVLEFDGAAAAAAAAAGGAAAAAAGPLRLYVRAQVVMLGGVETLLVRATEMVDAADLPPPGAEGEAPGGPTGAAALDRFGRIWQKAWEQGGTKVKVRAAHVLEVLQKGEVKVTHVDDDTCDLELGTGNTRTLKALKVANTSGTGPASPAPADVRLYEVARCARFELQACRASHEQRLSAIEAAVRGGFIPLPGSVEKTLVPTSTADQEFPIPSLPSNASSVLVRVQTRSGYVNGQDTPQALAVWAKGSPDAVHHLKIHRYTQAAWSYDNDSMWLALGGTPVLVARFDKAIAGNGVFRLKVEGYRTL